ncbi:Iojap protein [Mucinivorans hirudinis]|uniref:Ribosomal silencing factor RsfS n=1 Tax=Mucinivorans hirudinis TaxID=1433126 RepID=A0A060R980_9BACT|nr:Iojap protein [Mucinivorans hirudinis]
MSTLLKTIVEAIEDKKGNNIISLDLSRFDGAICKYFVICNAESTVQVSAIADGVEQDVRKKLGEKVWRVNGRENSLWIAMDYGDIVVHIFQTQMRDYYRLEELWGDAPITKY